MNDDPILADIPPVETIATVKIGNVHYTQPPPELAAAILGTLGAVERLAARMAELQEAVARLEARR